MLQIFVFSLDLLVLFSHVPWIIVYYAAVLGEVVVVVVVVVRRCCVSCGLFVLFISVLTVALPGLRDRSF